MKNFIVLEFYSKKENLGCIEIDTPNEFLLVNSTEPVLNNRIFDDFMDSIFTLVTEKFEYRFGKKVINVYVTFIDDNDNFVCSIILDKLNKKKSRYRARIINWEETGYTFKYADAEEVQNEHDCS